MVRPECDVVLKSSMVQQVLVPLSKTNFDDCLQLPFPDVDDKVLAIPAIWLQD